MNVTSKHVDGITVVSVGAGERLGKVAEVLLDPDEKRVTAFQVQSGGQGLLPSADSTETWWLAAEDVRSIGPDALTIQDATSLRESPPSKPMLQLGDLLKRKVVTEGGVYVGSVDSIEFDQNGMAITQIEVSAGFFKSNRMVSADQIVNVGQELVVVADEVCADDSDRSEIDADQPAEEQSRIVGDVEPRSTDPR